VRRPPAYVAEVFQMQARAQGLALGAPVFSESAPPEAQVLVEHDQRAAGGSCAA
jgi:D-alanyl-D-alanine carboxypeptidase